jgi:hypothetical protein
VTAEIIPPTTGTTSMPYGELATLLLRYIEIADRKDVAAAVALLGTAIVRFPDDEYDTPEGALGFWQRLWSTAEQHRHDVSNILLEPTDDPHVWRLRAHYSRWLFFPEPLLSTLGEYEMVAAFDGPTWRVRELSIHKTWVRSSRE